MSKSSSLPEQKEDVKTAPVELGHRLPQMVGHPELGKRPFYKVRLLCFVV